MGRRWPTRCCVAARKRRRRHPCTNFDGRAEISIRALFGSRAALPRARSAAKTATRGVRERQPGPTGAPTIAWHDRYVPAIIRCPCCRSRAPCDSPRPPPPTASPPPTFNRCAGARGSRSNRNNYVCKTGKKGEGKKKEKEKEAETTMRTSDVTRPRWSRAAHSRRTNSLAGHRDDNHQQERSAGAARHHH